MPGGIGPREWVVGTGGLAYIDGVPCHYLSVDDQSPSDPGVLPTQAGTVIIQRLFRGATAPSSLRPMIWTVKVQAADEDATGVFLDAPQRGAAVSIFMDLPLTEVWDAQPGQQSFSTSRRLPYGATLVGGPEAITPTTRPCRAFINGAEQVVVYTGAPAVGQVLVSAGAYAQNRSVTTHAGLTSGQVLKLRYSPISWATVSLPQRSLSELNNWILSFQINEQIQGDWS
jgi:hypothetical protein